MNRWDWAFWGAGGVVGVAGLLLCAWAMFRDRSRGRRRCPRCWYDMSGVPGMKCPECGRVARSEKRFLRTRRRWRWGAVGVAIGLLGAGTALVPAARSGTWVAYVPVPALNMVLSRFSKAAEKEYAAATPTAVSGGMLLSMSGPGPLPPGFSAKLDRWQRLLVAQRCATLLTAEVAASRPAGDDEGWERMISSPSLTARSTASLMLPQLGIEARPALTVLFEMLRTGDPGLQESAGLILGELKPETGNILGRLKGMLKSPYSPAREGACIALAFFGPDAHSAAKAVARLIRNDPSARVRAAAVFAIPMIAPDDETSTMLAACFQDRDRMVRLAAVRSMGLLMGLSGSSKVIAGLADADWRDYQARRTSAIRPTGSVAVLAVATIQSALADPEPEVRIAAARFLWIQWADAASAAEALMSAIEREPEARVRRVMVRARSAIGPTARLVPYLIDMLDGGGGEAGGVATEDWVTAAIELGRYGDESLPAIPRLLVLAGPSSGRDAMIVVGCLRRLGTGAAPALGKLLEDPRVAIRRAVAQSLRTPPMDPCGEIAALGRALDDRDAEVRLEVVCALWRCPSEAQAYLEKLGELLMLDASKEVRQNAVLAVLIVGGDSAQAVQLVGEALHDSEEQVRYLAAARLALLGARAAPAQEALRSALEDSSGAVRRTAAEALRAIDGGK